MELTSNRQLPCGSQNSRQAALAKIVVLLVLSWVGLGGCTNSANPSVNPIAFFESCDGSTLEPQKWKIAKRNWGGQQPPGTDYNGGVIPENVEVRDGLCILRANGNLYDGPLLGINKDGTPRADGKRTGAGIATNEYFASGRYQARVRVAPEFGVASALWTFHYREFYPGDPEYIEKPVGGTDYYALNHEIDIEIPGRPGPAATNISFDRALMNTWVGENGDEHTVKYEALGKLQNDGAFHDYRFDWHTGGAGQTARVEFYVDGVLITTSTTHIPTAAGRFWLGAWFPIAWAGEPDFDVVTMEIDWVRITPFNEPGDEFVEESFPDFGWAEDDEFP